MSEREKELSNYLLQDLRKIAKEKGAKSPSSLPKNDLIKEIIKLENGILTPSFSRRGRPNKKRLAFNGDSPDATENPTTTPQLISKEKEKQILELTNTFIKNVISILNK